MPRQERKGRGDLEALAARAHQLSALLAGTRTPGRAAERSVAHLQAELLQIEKLLLILADESPSAETPEMQDEDLVTVTEAARRLGVPRTRVHYWVKQGTVPVAQTKPARRVSLAAVRQRVEAMAPDPSGEYVQPFEAARVAGVPASKITAWARRGTVATRHGPYGRLVRLADVQALAEQGRTAPGEGKHDGLRPPQP